MLKKIYRLSSVRLNNSRNAKSKLFNIKTAKSGLEYPRFGFVISKKIDKRAVIRNSLKRKLSKCIEEIFDRIEGGHDFVFYPKQEVLEIKQEDLGKEIERVFKKMGFLNV